MLHDYQLSGFLNPRTCLLRCFNCLSSAQNSQSTQLPGNLSYTFVCHLSTLPGVFFRGLGSECFWIEVPVFHALSFFFWKKKLYWSFVSYHSIEKEVVSFFMITAQKSFTTFFSLLFFVISEFIRHPLKADSIGNPIVLQCVLHFLLICLHSWWCIVAWCKLVIVNQLVNLLSMLLISHKNWLTILTWFSLY